jgi:hypothetical protein
MTPGQKPAEGVELQAEGQTLPSPMNRGPAALVSYARDPEEAGHQEWIEDLASRLRADGIDIRLDVWHVHPGEQLTAFMETGVRECNFVLMVCTPRYKLRSDGRAGGVGYESAVITGELLSGSSPRKFIPLLRTGNWRDAGPSPLLGSYYLDLRDDPTDQRGYKELLDTLLDRRRKAPPLVTVRPTSGPPVGPTLPGSPSAITTDDFLRVLSAALSRRKALSQCIAEALRLAVAGGHNELRTFCERELRGFAGFGSIDKRDADFPHYRVYGVYVSLEQVNPQFYGWNQNPENVFAYMDAHPKDFSKLQTIAAEPISQLEAQAARGEASSPISVKHWTSFAGAVLPTFDKPDIRTYCYARRDIDGRILEAIRGELTRLLMDMLPPMSTAKDSATEAELRSLYERKYGSPVQ